jgi:hypothetical protein
MNKEVRDDIEGMIYQIEAVIKDFDGWYHWNQEASDMMWEEMKKLIKKYCDPKKGMYIDNIIRG